MPADRDVVERVEMCVGATVAIELDVIRTHADRAIGVEHLDGEPGSVVAARRRARAHRSGQRHRLARHDALGRSDAREIIDVVGRAETIARAELRRGRERRQPLVVGLRHFSPVFNGTSCRH